MGLKGDRIIKEDCIDFYLNEAATRGVIATISTVGSGVSLDNPSQLATIAANPSGSKVAGVLLNDVVDIDTSREFLNTRKNEVIKGSKVQLAKEGMIVTDDIEVGTVTAGEAAYIGNSGQFATDAAIAGYGCAVTEESNATSYPKVGRFLTTKDENGYCRIDIEIN